MLCGGEKEDVAVKKAGSGRGAGFFFRLGEYSHCIGVSCTDVHVTDDGGFKTSIKAVYL